MGWTAVTHRGAVGKSGARHRRQNLSMGRRDRLPEGKLQCLCGRYDPGGQLPGRSQPYGALDMAGNVLEWVADWYSASYYSISPKRNPTGAASGDTKLLRGGSWDVDIYANARSAYRTYCGTDCSLSDIGFRCAISAAH